MAAGGLAAAGIERVLTGTLYVALFSDELDLVAETGSELTDANYARVSCASWATSSGAGYVQVANDAAVVFPVFAGDTDEKEAVSWGLYTAASGGDLLAGGLVRNVGGDAEPGAINGGDQFRFDLGSLRIRTVTT